MSWRHFSRNTAQAITTYWQDEPDGSITIASEQDVDAILDVAKAHANRHTDYRPWRGDLHHVASIPMTLFMELHKQGVTQDQQALRAVVNDPALAKFRTKAGRV